MTEEDKVCFTDYLQSKNIWKTSIERYISQVEKFAEWLKSTKEKSLLNAEKKDVLDYMLYIQNLSGSTRQHRLGILSHYYTFLVQSDQVGVNPIRGIKLRGTRKKLLPSVLTTQETEELLDTHFVMKVKPSEEEEISHKGRFVSPKYMHLRNHLILSLCVYQGLSRLELVSLTLGDVDLQKATITIKAQRQTNARKLPLHATQIGIFYIYLDESRQYYKLDDDMLLSPKFQTHVLTNELRKIYPKFRDFPQLRASVIMDWIKNSGLRKAQHNAGHRYISSTERYLANDMESLKEDIAVFHPI